MTKIPFAFSNTEKGDSICILQPPRLHPPLFSLQPYLDHLQPSPFLSPAGAGARRRCSRSCQSSRRRPEHRSGRSRSTEVEADVSPAPEQVAGEAIRGETAGMITDIEGIWVIFSQNAINPSKSQFPHAFRKSRFLWYQKADLKSPFVLPKQDYWLIGFSRSQ